jgi:glycogen debranching enzyme
MMLIRRKLTEAVNNLFKSHTVNNFAVNDDQATWMDTLFNGDGRKGVRIEIQALRIGMYRFMHTLTKSKVYKDMADKLIAKTKEQFWNGTFLKDGIEDGRARPNVFIAAYLCPELLSKAEWVKCFESILPRLWLEWGGLATLDKNEPGFHPDNTGEDSSSYHHGDSWFWLNNLAALVLYRTDKKKFKRYIDKILGASCDDILFRGFIGCHSEISSASEKKALGCWSQAWSNAMFVELVEEIYS